MNNCRRTHVETWAIAGGTRSLQSWPRLRKMEKKNSWRPQVPIPRPPYIKWLTHKK